MAGHEWLAEGGMSAPTDGLNMFNKTAVGGTCQTIDSYILNVVV